MNSNGADVCVCVKGAILVDGLFVDLKAAKMDGILKERSRIHH